MSRSRLKAVFYADSYHPIQAGSIDGTDTLPHDNAVYRAFLCSSAGLYDPFGDPKVSGDPYCTVFVGRLNHLTTEDTLHKAMSKYGRIKSLRLVRHIVTGASQGYAFVEYETEREMRRAYEDSHHSIVDDCEIIVDYNRQQLMPGWIPRRLGGGLGGRKESGQLRFGGRERPFRAPLVPIPLDDLKRLGIPPPPEGRYMSSFQVPPPPRRKRSSVDRDELSPRGTSMDRGDRYPKDGSVEREEFSHRGSYLDREDHYHIRRSVERDWEENSHRKSSKDQKSSTRSHRRSSVDMESRRSHKRSTSERETRSHKTSSSHEDEGSNKRSSGDRCHGMSSTTDRNEHSHRNSTDEERQSHKRHRHANDSNRQH